MSYAEILGKLAANDPILHQELLAWERELVEAQRAQIAAGDRELLNEDFVPIVGELSITREAIAIVTEQTKYTLDLGNDSR